MKVCDLMCDHVISISPQEPVTSAARLLREQNIGALPVCGDSGELCGVITDRDIVTRCVAAGGSPGEMTVGDVMTAGVVTVSPFVPSGEAARKMADAQIRRLPVCNNGELVGMISLGDLARSRDCGMEAAAALSEISGNVHRK